jgi:hypothetical protein
MRLTLAGLHKHSIAFVSDGSRRHNQPFTPASYGPEYAEGDVIGVGYRPRTGTVFFTRNGKKLDDVAHGLKTQNFFPTVGAKGPCQVHVNFGQLGFVFIEANVKKWGLAPTTGSLAPPPPYGSEQGSILLEGGSEGNNVAPFHNALLHYGHGRSSSQQIRVASRPPLSPGPQRSPTDISLAQLSIIASHEQETGESSSAAAAGAGLTINVESADAPPEYESPTETHPLVGEPSPPIPSYDTAIAQGRSQGRT